MSLIVIEEVEPIGEAADDRELILLESAPLRRWSSGLVSAFVGSDARIRVREGQVFLLVLPDRRHSLARRNAHVERVDEPVGGGVVDAIFRRTDSRCVP